MIASASRPSHGIAVLSIGDELLAGVVADTNLRDIADALAGRGLSLAEARQVGDDDADIATALNELGCRHRTIIATGGLGPTGDDRTRQAVARWLGRELVERPAQLARLRDFFASRGRPFPESNRIQACFPRGARALPNPVGTAEGFALAAGGGRRLFALPGVPVEMRRMLEDQVLPRLGRPAGIFVRRRSVECAGISESALAELLGPWLEPGHRPRLGTRVHAGGISVRVTCRESGAQRARVAATQWVRRVRARLGDHAFGTDGQTLCGVLLAALGRRRETLAFAESCTGGLAVQLFSREAGASRVLRGAIVAYADELKRRRLGVSPGLLARGGAVAAPVALAMARGARRALGADWGLAITGIAGPGGGSRKKPVGTVHVAVVGPGVRAQRSLLLSGERRQVQDRAALYALDLLRRTLP